MALLGPLLLLKDPQRPTRSFTARVVIAGIQQTLEYDVFVDLGKPHRPPNDQHEKVATVPAQGFVPRRLHND